jgi:hypothetical protein
MGDVEPDGGVGGVAGWLVIGVVLAGVVLLAFAGLLIFQSFDIDTASKECSKQ